MTLLHGSFEPLLYGVIIFLGLFSLVFKIKHGMWLAFFAELTVFIIVFKLHGGTMSGGFAATVAALIAGIVFPIMFRTRS
jgi:hypothetical protein